MSIYESSITNPKKQLEFYKDLSEQLQQENEKLHHYKTLYQSLKSQKEELREWLEEKIICYENMQNTNLGEYERKLYFDLHNDVLSKMEELEGVNDED